ncbi:MAG: hypothetical protein U1E46_11080 [Hyphomicrobiales bacterium]
MKKLIAAAVLAAIVLPADVAAAADCGALKDDYTKTVKPKLARVISRNPSVANDYLQNLNSIKKGENPTPAELDKAHQMTAADCDKDTGAADCKAFAKDMLTAAKLSYDVNKKWVLAGCPGTLTSITKKSSD